MLNGRGAILRPSWASCFLFHNMTTDVLKALKKDNFLYRVKTAHFQQLHISPLSFLKLSNMLQICSRWLGIIHGWNMKNLCKWKHIYWIEMKTLLQEEMLLIMRIFILTTIFSNDVCKWETVKISNVVHEVSLYKKKTYECQGCLYDYM